MELIVKIKGETFKYKNQIKQYARFEKEQKESYWYFNISMIKLSDYENLEKLVKQHNEIYFHHNKKFDNFDEIRDKIKENEFYNIKSIFGSNK